MLAGQRITSRRQGLPGALLPVVLLVLTGKVLHPLRGTPAYAVRRVLKDNKSRHRVQTWAVTVVFRNVGVAGSD